MTPDEKERYRWQFAGNFIQAGYNAPAAVEFANDLIAELEKTAPKDLKMRDLKSEIEERIQVMRELNCDHEWQHGPTGQTCSICGKVKKLRTKEQGGMTFTVCDDCRDKK